MPVFHSLITVLAGDHAGAAVAAVLPQTSPTELALASVPFLGFLVVSFAAARLIARLSAAPA